MIHFLVYFYQRRSASGSPKRSFGSPKRSFGTTDRSGDRKDDRSGDRKDGRRGNSSKGDLDIQNSFLYDER